MSEKQMCHLLDHGDYAIGATCANDTEFLAMLAMDVDVLDTTPAEALKGDVVRMPELATVVIDTECAALAP